MTDRTITVGPINWEAVPGRFVVVPVKVGWPELQLTEAQVMANAAAVATVRPAPFPDLSYITVRIERPHD